MADAGGGAEDPFIRLDATAQAELVRSRQVKPIELVDAAIARIERLNGALNAVTATFFERGRERAKGMEYGPFEGKHFPGVPYLIKDLTVVEGEPITYGSRFFGRTRARGNEPVSQAALDAGLVPLGKTNTPEFGLLGVTEPMLHGPTANPWSLEHSPGGSSGGSAAAVAAGLTPIASGGDGGGSLRIPASCCGLVGLKPSRGRALSPVRQTPGGLSVSMGLSRSVRDTAALLAMLEHHGDAARFDPIGVVSGPSTRRLRIAVARHSITGAEPHPHVAAALEETAALCAELGHTVEEAAPEVDGQEAVERFLVYWGGVPANLMRVLPLLRLRDWNWMRKRDGFEPWTLGLADWYFKRLRWERDANQRSEVFFRKALRTYEAFFTRYDAILSPVLRLPPARTGEMAPDLPFDALLERCVDYVSYTPVHNAIGTPAISVPLSMSPEGLPIGAQFAARPGDERTLLELAYELEAARPWADRWPELPSTL